MYVERKKRHLDLRTKNMKSEKVPIYNEEIKKYYILCTTRFSWVLITDNIMKTAILRSMVDFSRNLQFVIFFFPVVDKKKTKSDEFCKA